MNVYVMYGPVFFTTGSTSYGFASSGAVNIPATTAAASPFMFPRSRHYVRR